METPFWRPIIRPIDGGIFAGFVLGRFNRSSEPDVHDLQAAFSGDVNIAGVDVSMNGSLLVCKSQAIEHFLNYSDGVVDVKDLLPGETLDISSAQQLSHQRDIGGRDEHISETDDVGVLQSVEVFVGAPEGIGELRKGSDVRGDYLYCHFYFGMVLICRLIDGPVFTTPYLFFELVVANSAANYEFMC